MALHRTELVRFVPSNIWPSNRAKHNVTHIVSQRDDSQVRTMCGSTFSLVREIADHDHSSRLCALCMRVKDGIDTRAHSA